MQMFRTLWVVSPPLHPSHPTVSHLLGLAHGLLHLRLCACAVHRRGFSGAEDTLLRTPGANCNTTPNEFQLIRNLCKISCSFNEKNWLATLQTSSNFTKQMSGLPMKLIEVVGHWFHLRQEQSKRLLRQKGFILLRLLAFFGSSPEKTKSEVGRAGIGRIQGLYDITHICQHVMDINTRKIFIYVLQKDRICTYSCVYTECLACPIFLWSRAFFFKQHHLVMVEILMLCLFKFPAW